MYETIHKRPFVQSVGGIGGGPSKFCETSPKATNGRLIPLDGSVNLCEKFVLRGREFGRLPLLNNYSYYDVPVIRYNSTYKSIQEILLILPKYPCF